MLTLNVLEKECSLPSSLTTRKTPISALLSSGLKWYFIIQITLNRILCKFYLKHVLCQFWIFYVRIYLRMSYFTHLSTFELWTAGLLVATLWLGPMLCPVCESSSTGGQTSRPITGLLQVRSKTCFLYFACVCLGNAMVDT